MRKPLFLLPAILLCLSAVSALRAAPVTIAAPPSGATISGKQVEIVVNFSSTDSLPVSRVDVILDGQMVTQRVFAPPVAGGRTAFNWDTTLTPNGVHMLDVIAAHGGDIIGSARCQITVSNRPEDRAAPSVSITSPRDGDVVSGTTPIVVQAFDDDGQEPFVSIYVDSSLRSVSNRGPFVYDWDTTQHENGPVMIDVAATDSSDNRAKGKPVRVIIRNAVKQVPIAAQSTEVPAMELTAAVPSTAAAATPSAPAGNSTEDARAASGAPNVEQFEVSATPSVGVTAPLPAATAPAAPSAPVAIEEPQAAASTLAAKAEPAPVAKAEPKPAPAAPLPDGVASDPAQETLLMAKALVSEPTRPAVKTDSRLSSPVDPTPKPTAVGPKAAPVKQPDTGVSETAEKPMLVVDLSNPDGSAAVSKADDGGLAAPALPAPKPTAVASIPAAPKAEIKVVAPAKPEAQASPAPSGVASHIENATLVAKLSEYDAIAPSSKNDLRLSAPVELAPRAGEVVAKAEAGVKTAKAPESPKVVVVQNSPAGDKVVKLRYVFENVGGTVNWDHFAKTVHAVMPQMDLRVKIGSPSADINSRQVDMGREAFIVNGRTMVPSTFVTGMLKMSANDK